MKHSVTRSWKPLAASKALIALLAVCALTFSGTAYAINLTTSSSENFDSIGTSATATLPADWKVSKDNSNVRTVGTYAAAVTATERQGGNNMSTTAANGIYNYGAGDAGTATDRAVGWLSSSSATKSGNLYAKYTNTTGQSLPSVVVSYNVEKYRQGSNSAGFRIQTYYSTDGSNWTSAGNNFLTSFAADADNSGYASAPGVTVAVSNQTLYFPSAIAAGTDFYLAWNYSVTSGTTTSNAQGLGIDNVTVATDLAPSVSSTDPSNGATNVALDKNIAITFGERVNVASGWYTISCGTSGSHTATVSTSDDMTFTVNPDDDFSHSETCTVTVVAADVTDQDTFDPPDTMASDYVFSFATVSLTDTAPYVAGTTPISGGVSPAVGATIVIDFSEAVNLTSTAVTLECPVGTTKTFSGLPADNVTRVTLTPSENLPYSTTCTATVVAAQVSDLDGIDPVHMAADYSWTFTTIADPCGSTSGLTQISYIQGSGLTSSYVNSIFTVEGIVVGDYETGGMKGYFVQEEDTDSDGNAATSEGIFVYDANSTSEVSLGDKVRVTGTVDEFSGTDSGTGATLLLTQLKTITSLAVCSSGQGSLVTTTSLSLPVTALTDLEPYEGMRVTFPQALTVTDNYDLGWYGQLTLSESDKLWQFTHLYPPSIPGYASYLSTIALRSILLDDGSTAAHPDPIIYPGTGLTALNTVRVGDTVAGLTGVLDQRYGLNRIQPLGQVDFTAANPRPTTAPAVGGNVQVGSFNTLNFFVTTGSSSICGPAGTLGCRGATDSAEFTRQRNKLVAAICGLDADVLGLMELENPYTGNDPYPGDGVSDYVLQNLVTALNASSACPDDYAFTDGTAAGTDAIRQGLIYKSTVVTPVGTTAILNTTAFINGGDSVARNRPALAQAFQEVATDERFVVAVNHLKSKGSACDAADTLDGQGNCAIVRTNAANALTAWLATDPTGAGDPDVLIVGDLNSYAKEAPITALVNAGYTDLVNWTVGSEGYSYGFDGMAGYLDHALASSTLLAQTLAANEWHINSDEPAALDYNVENKTTAQQTSLYNPDAYRSTDHDPVLVGLNLATTDDLSDLTGYPVAWHSSNGLKLGATWAAGHSTVGSGTNDGVVRTPGIAWSPASGGSVDVTVNGATGYVTGWIDWNNDGDCGDSGEQIFTNEAFSDGQQRTITFAIPAAAPIAGGSGSAFNARFRVYPTAQTVLALAAAAPDAVNAAPSPSGGATGGEVEDYTWSFGPNAVTLRTFGVASSPLSTWPAAAGLGLLGAVVLIRRRRR